MESSEKVFPWQAVSSCQLWINPTNTNEWYDALHFGQILSFRHETITQIGAGSNEALPHKPHHEPFVIDEAVDSK